MWAAAAVSTMFAYFQSARHLPPRLRLWSTHALQLCLIPQWPSSTTQQFSTRMRLPKSAKQTLIQTRRFWFLGRSRSKLSRWRSSRRSKLLYQHRICRQRKWVLPTNKPARKNSSNTKKFSRQRRRRNSPRKKRKKSRLKTILRWSATWRKQWTTCRQWMITNSFQCFRNHRS